jgi:AbrB family looped-hinge helix DNA binding protein
MRGTIDKAGRLVIPKPLRDRVGLQAGEVELTVDGTAIRIVPIHDDELMEEDGFLIVPPSGTPIDDDLVQALRLADQR